VSYEPVGQAEVVERAPGRVRLRAGRATVEVTALAGDLFRVGLFPEGRPVRYPSEAVVRTDWPAVGEPPRDADGGVELAAGEATAHLALAPLRIGFSDGRGRRFARDGGEGMGIGTAAGFAGGAGGLIGPTVRLAKAREPGERYFGCGERTGGLEKTGSRQVFWNVDPPMGHSASNLNLYTSIPFLLSLCDGRAHGLFLDNTHRVEFDLAKADPELATLEATGGDLVYYVFAGPTPAAVLERYTELTGRTPLPPLWAIGNQQARWSYMDADEVRGIARGFRERGIPCDVLYLDIDYMDGYRVFTWDESRFPDPAAFLAELREQGFRVVTIIDPGVKVDEDYPVYVEGRERGYFCRTWEGEEYHNVVWPGVCAFPDFTQAATRKWWGDLHAGLLDAGVAGIWCDMDEPAMFVPQNSTMPDDVVHPGDDEPQLHGQVHNLYGSGMARATREGLARLRPDRRPFVISRAGYAGLQRHALQWTGDNNSWWEHLWMAMPQLQNMGLSGVAHAGVDVGGFNEDATGELLARWMELGAFQPFCRNHSAMYTHAQEPWAFGEPYEGVCRDMLRLRMRLLPYLYAAFEAAARTGAPILRPLLFAHPDDPVTYAADDELLVGPDLLLAPIARPGIEHRHVYLPAGTWVQWWTGERVDGPAHVLAHAPLGRPALYARANAAIPMWPALDHVEAGAPDPLTLRVAVAAGAPEARTALFEDSGEGDGPAARRSVICAAAGDEVMVRVSAREGGWTPPRERVRVELRGLGDPEEVSVDGEPQEHRREADGALVVELAESPAERLLALRLR
jgi:alpha-glucosidase